jgi:hypothetical protein
MRKTKKYKKQFLYNPQDPKLSFDVYIDKNPNDTINIKYTTINDVKNTIKKLETLYKTKKYPHKRIWQVGMIMKVRLEAIKKHKTTIFKKTKNINKRYSLAKQYFKFLGKRTTKKTFTERKNMIFHHSY